MKEMSMINVIEELTTVLGKVSITNKISSSRLLLFEISGFESAKMF